MIPSGIVPLDEQGFEFEQGLNLVVGPVASGKTAVALTAARQADKVLVVSDGADSEARLRTYFNGKPPENLTISTNESSVTRRNFSLYDMIVIDVTSFRSEWSPARKAEMFRQIGHYAVNHHCVVILCIQMNRVPLGSDAPVLQRIPHAAGHAAFSIVHLRPDGDSLNIEIAKSRDTEGISCIIPFSDLIPNFKHIDAPLLEEEPSIDLWEALGEDD